MAEPRKRRERKPPKPVTATSLENAAVFYLSRFASSSGNLRRVLMRKVARSARVAEDAEAETASGAKIVDAIVERFVEKGFLDDKTYATQTASSLARRGTSRFSIAGKLAQKGVDAEMRAEAIETLDEDGGGSELAAACALVRRKRLGPYRVAEKREEWRQKDLASLARAGFRLDLARRVLKAATVEALEVMARGDEDAE
jgi:regulatory protein